MEMTLSQLGHIVRKEQQNDKYSEAASGRRHSKSRQDTRKRAKEIMKDKGFD